MEKQSNQLSDKDRITARVNTALWMRELDADCGSAEANPIEPLNTGDAWHIIQNAYKKGPQIVGLIGHRCAEQFH